MNAPDLKKPRSGVRETRALLIERAAINQEARTVEIAFASETPYERWWGVEVLGCKPEEVRLDRLRLGGPLLDCHDPDEQIGVVESCRVDADGICRALVRFSRNPEADEIFQDVLDGIRRNVSVGYMIHQLRLESETEGVSTYRATDWEPYELSIVSIPADTSVGVGRELDLSPPALLSERTPDMTGTAPAAPTPAALAAPAPDSAAIRAQAYAEIQARNTELVALGDRFKAPELARQAVLEGRDEQWLRDAILERTATAPLATRGYITVDDNFDQKRHGFRSIGEFAHHVREAALGRGRVDERLVRASASTVGTDQSGPDGGFAVPPEFATEITRPALGEDSLLSLCDSLPVTGNSMTYPKDESTPWGSTGIYAGWEAEMAAIAQKKPAIGESTLRLKKLAVLVPATDELLADSPAMGAYLNAKMGEAVTWKVNDAIVNGNGVGMPLGILASGSLISVAKESGQAAATLLAGNVAKMYARVLNRGNLVWLSNPDVFPQITMLSLNNNPIWVPASSGFREAPDGLLLGRRVIQTDACATVGSVGDLILCNMSGYRAITKAGGEEFASSVHLWFDQDLTAFRLTFRMDGQPILENAITPPRSTNKRSHFATTAAR